MISAAQFLKWCKIFHVGTGGGGGGTGDVNGPSSSVSGGPVVFDGTTGKLLKNGSITNEIYVSNKQAGTGTGTSTNPFATVDEAVAIAVTGSVILLDTGSYAATPFLAKPISIIGVNQRLTTLVISTITLNDTVWQVTSAPKFNIQNVTLSGTIDLTSSTIKSDSYVILNNVKATNLQITNMANVNLINFETPTIELTDCAVLNAIDSTFPTLVNGVSNSSTLNFELNNCSTPEVSLVTNSGQSISLTLRNMRSLQKVTTDDLSFSATLSIYYDVNSYPANGFNDISGAANFTSLTNIARGVDTSAGFGIGAKIGAGFQSTSFGWTGSATHTFFFGNTFGPTVPPGTNNFFGGKSYNPGSFSNCFVWSEETGNAIAPTASNQFAIRALAGYGFGAVSRANFDVKAGTKNDFVASMGTEVADASVDNSAVNFWMSGDVLKRKYRTAAGVIRLINDGPTIELTGTGLTLNANCNYVINRGSGGLYALSFMAPGDELSVYIQDVGQATIATFGAQIISYLDKGFAVSSDTVDTTQKNQFVNFKCIATDVIIVTAASGELIFSNGPRQNILGSDPTLYGDVDVTGRLVVAAATQMALQPSFQTTESSFYVSSGVISSGDVYGGNVLFNPGAAQTFTLPAASAIEATLTSVFGSARSINETFWVTFSNTSTLNPCNIAGSADFTLLNGTFVLAAQTTRNAKFKKVSGSPLGYAVVL